MKKPLKYTLLGLGGLLALVIAGAAVFALTFDPNRYKGQVERLVKDKTGRTLKLQGDLALAFYPALGAKVAGVTLSERGSDAQFIALESAHASVALLPLLRGEAIVDGIRVAGLKANIVKHKDGRFNFSDLLELGAQDPKKPAPPSKDEAGKGSVGFEIAGVQIERASARYLDQATGQELSLEDLKLVTGRIAERADGKLELKAKVKGKKPDLDVALDVGSGYRFDLPAKSYALSKLDAKLNGIVDKQSFDVQLSSPELVVATDKAKGELNVDAKLKDAAREIAAKLKLAGIEGSAKALVIPQLTADVSVSGQPPLKVAITGSAKADLEKQTANADLVAKLDDTTMQAKLGLAKFSPPAYVFDINIDKLNVDKYFPPAQASAPAPAGKPAPKAQAAAETPVDLSALKGLDANGQLQVGALQARGLKLANLKAKVHAANGRLDVSPHSAELYQGTLAGALSAQADGNRIAMKENLTGVAIGPLLQDVVQKDLLEGKGNVALDVTAAGATVEQMKKALAGTARTQLKDGAIKGINLAETVRKAKSMFGGGGGGEQGASATDKTQKTDFSELTASFTIKNGVAHNEDLDIKSPLFRIGGAGDIDIGNSKLDYLTKASVVATTKGQGGDDLSSLRGLTVPVRLSGPFEDLKYSVDYRGAAGNLAKSKTGEQVKEQVKEQREKIEDKIKGLLRR